MADYISTLPDDVLYHILSFLPTNASVATCVLSKRWNPLWRSVPTLNFPCGVGCNKYVLNIKTNPCFVDSVDAFLKSSDCAQSLKRFHIRCCASDLCYDLYKFVAHAASKNTLEQLDLHLVSQISLPSVVFSCKTLVELKLVDLRVQPFSSVDLPSLKTLCFVSVTLPEYRNLGDLLSGCPNLLDLKLERLYFHSFPVEGNFQKLSKLVKADIGEFTHFLLEGPSDDNFPLFPFEVFSNVQFLHIHQMEYTGELFPEFSNLTHLELTDMSFYKYNWMEFLKVLKHCPKLQNLVIMQLKQVAKKCKASDTRCDWEYPLCPPECISTQLKTCSLNNYCGYGTEFEFVTYIMQNAPLLQVMKIYSCPFCSTSTSTLKQDKLKKLSMSTRLSPTCKLSFV